MDITPNVINVIQTALQEDIGYGDITTSLLIPEGNKSKAHFIANEPFVLAGLPFALKVFHVLDSFIKSQIYCRDGTRVRKGSVIAEISGKTHNILKGERVSLNILQRLSGIATLTNIYVEKIEGSKAKIIDTRKTTPCLRFMEKYAVRVGGGYNHRFGLFDGVLIKDNHIKASGGIQKAVKAAKKGHHLLKIEVEVKNLQELKEAIAAGVDIIMLDNMTVEKMKEAVKISGGRALLEASGNIKPENVSEVARTGVDLISVGALTHSSSAVDISLKIV